MCDVPKNCSSFSLVLTPGAVPGCCLTPKRAEHYNANQSELGWLCFSEVDRSEPQGLLGPSNFYGQSTAIIKIRGQGRQDPSVLRRLFGRKPSRPPTPLLSVIAFNRMAFGPRPGDLDALIPTTSGSQPT